MEEAGATVATLRRLKGLGVRIAIDDFGTGYSSLSYLQRFPVDLLKIDKTFVDGLGRDPEASTIVRAVIGLADALGLQAVAEGVERVEQLGQLRALGCELGQGYHFAKPLSREAAEALFVAAPDVPDLALRECTAVA
jgi:EAL domain-containing protein (putative c-di-GMP-specific phosphodiesterase class I)